MMILCNFSELAAEKIFIKNFLKDSQHENNPLILTKSPNPDLLMMAGGGCGEFSDMILNFKDFKTDVS